MANVNSKTTKAEMLKIIETLEMVVANKDVELANLMDELVELNDRVHNLTIYLEYVKAADKDIWKALRNNFSGMPGFVSQKRSHRKKTKEEAK